MDGELGADGFHAKAGKICPELLLRAYGDAGPTVTEVGRGLGRKTTGLLQAFGA